LEENKKSGPLKTIITISVSLAIAALFMWFALKGMEFKKIAGYFAKANYFWVFAAALFGILAYWFRAVRWNLLLEPMGYKISNSNAFWTISFGYLMNLTIPRSGEVARSTALFGVEKVPVDKSFGTIILERVVDLVCMGGFLLLTLIFKYDAILSFYQYVTQEKSKAAEPQSNTNLYIFLGVVLLSGILFFTLRKRLEQFTLYQKILKFATWHFSTGLDVDFQDETKGKVHCFIRCDLDFLLSGSLPRLFCTSGKLRISHFADGFFIIVVGTLGMMVPASGGIGAFHFALKHGHYGVVPVDGKRS